MPMRERARSAAGSIWARALVTGALLALVASRVDWSAAADRLAEGSWAWFGAAVAVLFASQAIAALRWRLLLDGAELERPVFAVLRAYLVGVFANNFLPTSVGGDFTRAWLVARGGPPLVRALLSVVVDRFMALWCLVAVAWLALAADPSSVPGDLATALLLVSGAGLAASALLIWFSLRGGRSLARRLPERVLGWARETRATLRLYRAQPRMLALVALLGLLFQALAVLAVWMVARAIDLHPSFALLAVVAPLVLLITLVPISIAGFGVREGGMVLLLGAAGYSATEATLLSLVGVAALVLSSLPGAVAMIVGRIRPPAEQPDVAPGDWQPGEDGEQAGAALAPGQTGDDAGAGGH
jgi:glycosyltransferase 2 family protein